MESRIRETQMEEAFMGLKNKGEVEQNRDIQYKTHNCNIPRCKYIFCIHRII